MTCSPAFIVKADIAEVETITLPFGALSVRHCLMVAWHLHGKLWYVTVCRAATRQKRKGPGITFDAGPLFRRTDRLTSCESIEGLFVIFQIETYSAGFQRFQMNRL